MLVAHLSDGSAYVAANRGGPQFRAWTSSVHLLAALVNLTYAANRQRGGKATRKPLVSPPTKPRPTKISVAELIKRHAKKPERG